MESAVTKNDTHVEDPERVKQPALNQWNQKWDKDKFTTKKPPEQDSESFRVYLVDDDLDDCAKNLFKNRRDINICSCSLEDYCIKSIALAREHHHKCRQSPFISTCNQFACNQGNLSLHDFYKLTSDYEEDATLFNCDVVMILGHSSALFAEDYKLITVLAKMKPTIVAFIGCGEGNTRFGPVVNMARILSCVCGDVTPIVGFYQRRVYVSELQDTNLIVGLQYYAQLLKYFKVTANQPQQTRNWRKQVARCARLWTGHSKTVSC